MAIVGVSIIAFSILFTLLYHGIRILFNVNKSIKGANYAVVGLFIIGVILLSIVGISNAKNHAQHEELSTVLSPDHEQGDTLFVALSTDMYFNENIKSHNSNFYDLTTIDNDRIILGEMVELDWYESSKDEFTVEIVKEATGASLAEAFKNIEDIDFEYEWLGDTLVLSPNIKVGLANKFHGQSVELNLFIPEGKCVYFIDGLDRIDIPGWGDEYIETCIYMENNYETDRPDAAETEGIDESEDTLIDEEDDEIESEL